MASKTAMGYSGPSPVQTSLERRFVIKRKHLNTSMNALIEKKRNELRWIIQVNKNTNKNPGCEAGLKLCASTPGLPQCLILTTPAV